MYREKRPILLCLDLEAGSEELAVFGATYAKRRGQPLHVLYVIPRSSSQEERVARERLERLAHRALANADIGAIVVKRGDVEDLIVAYADEKGMDLIVLGHRHRARRERVYVGSTVGAVISMAPGPVLVVPIDTEGRAS